MTHAATTHAATTHAATTHSGTTHAATTHSGTGKAEGQQHPIRLYLVVWGWLFVLSTFSYLVDYFEVQGAMRYSLILTFMVLKAALIVAVFMHLAWERLALVYAMLVPIGAILVFVWIMADESVYTLFTRMTFLNGS